jgi:hypothetical protein
MPKFFFNTVGACIAMTRLLQMHNITTIAWTSLWTASPRACTVVAKGVANGVHSTDNETKIEYENVCVALFDTTGV